MSELRPRTVSTLQNRFDNKGCLLFALSIVAYGIVLRSFESFI